jgi:hypothetical protein
MATASDPTVAELQRVLTIYAQATGYAPANPGAVDGIVGQRTALAVAAMVPRLPGLPAEVVAMAPLISLMLATDQGRNEIFALIKRQATTITRAVIALEAYRLATQQQPTAPAGGGKTPVRVVLPGVFTPPQPQPPATTPPPFMVPWWQTTGGKVAIGAGVAATLLTVVVVIRAFAPR